MIFVVVLVFIVYATGGVIGEIGSQGHNSFLMIRGLSVPQYGRFSKT